MTASDEESSRVHRFVRSIFDLQHVSLGIQQPSKWVRVIGKRIHLNEIYNLVKQIRVQKRHCTASPTSACFCRAPSAWREPRRRARLFAQTGYVYRFEIQNLYPNAIDGIRDFE